MWTTDFWKATAERALKTLAQTLLSVVVVGGVVLNIFTVDWMNALGIGLGAMLVSVLTSILSSFVGSSDSPSLVSSENEGGRHEI
jgi:hypothetical protein